VVACRANDIAQNDIAQNKIARHGLTRPGDRNEDGEAS
jgi:hypothetical protein